MLLAPEGAGGMVAMVRSPVHLLVFQGDNPMPSQSSLRAGALLLMSVLVATATAQTVRAPGSTSTAAARALFDKPAAVADLARLRGGTQITKNDITLAGTTASNTANHVSTGSNAISEGAFTNMSGIPVVIQNSGANVLIQNAVIVHLQLE